MAPTATIKQLVVYPIKSCMGIELPSATLTPLGLAWDRRWVVVDAASGRFITQRQMAKLCLVKVQLPLEAVAAADWGAVPADAAMVVTAPGLTQQLLVRLQLPPLQDRALRTCTVWEWSGSALDEGEDAAAWFSAYLGRPCRLMRYLGSLAASTGAAGADAASGSREAAGGTPLPADAVRPVDTEWAVGAEVAFADGFPMLFATEESLQALNNQLPAALPMNRFRPNVVVAGAGTGWAEDSWASLHNGDGVVYSFVKPCSRCKVTTIDQQSGTEGHEPLQTLSVLRSGKVLGWSKDYKPWTHAVFFGWNAVPSGPGRLAVGDVLSVVSK